jgi:phage protein D
MCAVHISHFSVKIDGSDVTEAFMDAVQEIVVDTSLYMPSMFTIRLDDHDLEWVDNALLDIGKEVEISAEAGDEVVTGSGLLVKAEITALEPDFAAGQSNSLVVRGYDKSHRLHRGRKTRTFAKKKDSDIASTLAQEAGLSAQVDATTITYDWVLQTNQTNMEFLMTRAARIGYQVYCVEGDLYFKKGDANRGDGPELEYGVQLLDFRPRWTASHQADDVTVYGWDPKGKTAVVSSAKAPASSLNQGGMTETGGAKTSSAFSAASEIIADQPVLTVDEANALAEGLSHNIGLAFVEAEGSCFGHPLVLPGYKINIKGVGTRFSGKYYVTSATHVRNRQGYETRFTISGCQPNTLNYLLRPGSGNGMEEGRVQGVVTALVTQLEDEDDLGRIKVKYPWLPKDPNGVEIESHWIRMASPMAGAQRGFQFLPEIDDEVLVAFEHGDVHRPYLIGALSPSPPRVGTRSPSTTRAAAKRSPFATRRARTSWSSIRRRTA